MSNAGSNRDLKTDESNLIVALRIRPMNEDEILNGATPIAHRVDDNLVVLMDPQDDIEDVLRANRSREKQYVFDMALDATSTQEDVYHKTCRFLIPSVINGYNATVFAYGATGAGKTYTMLGRDDDQGIMVQALTELFYLMGQTQDELIYRVTMSYLEIYNEMIRDLLNPTSGYLDLREDHKGVQVAGLSEHSAKSTAEVMGILMEGNKQRTQEPTAANQTSSRSHAVLMISVRQRSRTQGINQQLRIGKLFLVDLAGSERAANTQNRGKRMVEGAHINRSLLALGNCINALSDKNGSKYINYRDSKLTRLLKDSLGGNCKTVMIAHISPANFFFEESHNTLSYADRAKNIRTKVRQNVLDMTLHISQYSSIITDLRDQIKTLKMKLDQQQQQQHIRNASTMHAIQSEVMQTSKYSEEPELSRLRKDLSTIHRSQNEIRRSLLDLTNTESIGDFEATRLQLEIKRWERENQRAGSHSNDGNMSRAQEEISVLHMDRDNAQRRKIALEKQLDNLKNKSVQIEQELGRLNNTEDQKEVAHLLSRAHALEVDNNRMQSDLLQRSLDLKHRELYIVMQDQHLAVSEDVIHQQRMLFGGNTEYPQPFNDLYNIYEQEGEDLKAQRHLFFPDINITNHNSRILKTDSLSSVDSSGRQFEDAPLPRLFLNENTTNRSENSSRLFVDAPNTELRKSRGSGGGGREIEDLILESEDRKQMANSTRSIAILAAHRRGGGKENFETYNERTKLNRSRQDGSNLTQSRLVQHDRQYGSLTVPQSADRVSNPTTVATDYTSQARKNRSTRAVSYAFTGVGESDRNNLDSRDIQGNRRKYPMASVPEISSTGYRSKVPTRTLVYRSKSLSKPRVSKGSSGPSGSNSPADTFKSDPHKSAFTSVAIPSTYRRADFGVTGYGLQ